MSNLDGIVGLVVAHWPSEVESTAPLDFLLRHGLWTPFGYPMSCKIRSIISATCDFTTKSDGIWKNSLSVSAPTPRLRPHTNSVATTRRLSQARPASVSHNDDSE